MDYTFQSDDNNSARKIWIMVIASVLAIIIGIALVSRASDRRASEENRENVTENTPPAIEVRETPSDGVKKVEDKKSERISPLPVLKTPKKASSEVLALLERGQQFERDDELEAARKAYEEALSNKDVGDARTLIESNLGNVFIKLIMSQREMAEKVDHAIVSGDLLQKLARKYGTTSALIANANGISNPNNIKIGDRLRILNHPKFEIVVSKSENWLLVKMNGKFFKRYTVGTGRYNRTPVGTFKIVDKIEKPTWWKENKQIPYGDPENILGTHWMAIASTGSTPPAKGYGIHGTWDNSSLGQQSSAGCVRMSNDDVGELFIYIPEGTPVTISE